MSAVERRLSQKIDYSGGQHRLLRSVDEAAGQSGLSTWYWRKKSYRGEVISHKIGTRLLIPQSEIDRIIAESERPRISTAMQRHTEEVVEAGSAA